jgi:hypothetical protein
VFAEDINAVCIVLVLSAVLSLVLPSLVCQPCKIVCQREQRERRGVVVGLISQLRIWGILLHSGVTYFFCPVSHWCCLCSRSQQQSSSTPCNLHELVYFKLADELAFIGPLQARICMYLVSSSSIVISAGTLQPWHVGGCSSSSWLRANSEHRTVQVCRAASHQASNTGCNS